MRVSCLKQTLKIDYWNFNTTTVPETTLLPVLNDVELTVDRVGVGVDILYTDAGICSSVVANVDKTQMTT